MGTRMGRRLRRLARRPIALALSSVLVAGAILETPTASAAEGAGTATRPLRNTTPDAPPPRITLPVKPHLRGEGVWRNGTYKVGGVSAVRLATFRPEPASPSVVAYVAWIDHLRTRLALYPGLAEPPQVSQRGSGEVPYGQRWRLLATFNGGFKANANAGGFLINGHADRPLLRGLGTLVAHRSGRVDIVSWHGPPARRNLDVARQNLPLLVNKGRVNANVGDVLAWGATLGGGDQVWRSAIGIDGQGDLLYAAADAQTPASLAQIMIDIGAQRAIELDINPEWPSFIAYGRRGGQNPLKLVPNPQESAERWLVPDTRDFFAVYTRAGGGSSVPFR